MNRRRLKTVLVCAYPRLNQQRFLLYKSFAADIQIFSYLLTMARTHHRRKHKQHLEQFKHRQDASASAPRSKATSVFAVMGFVAGLFISYFIFDGAWLPIAAISIIAGVAGYYLGKNVDRRK